MLSIQLCEKICVSRLNGLNVSTENMGATREDNRGVGKRRLRVQI